MGRLMRSSDTIALLALVRAGAKQESRLKWMIADLDVDEPKQCRSSKGAASAT